MRLLGKYETATEAKLAAAIVALGVSISAGCVLIWPTIFSGKRKSRAWTEQEVLSMKEELMLARGKLTVSDAAIASKDSAYREAQGALRRCLAELNDLRATNAQLANELTMTQAATKGLRKTEAGHFSPNTPLVAALPGNSGLLSGGTISENNSEVDGTEWGGSQVSEAVSTTEVSSSRSRTASMSANKTKFEKVKRERNALKQQLQHAQKQIEELRVKLEQTEKGTLDSLFVN